MGILKWLFSKKNRDSIETQSKVSNDFLDTNVESEAVCPYCKKKLNKFPLRKTKCPHCEQFNLVRNLSNLKIKTLLTEEQVKEIEIEQTNNYLKFKGFNKLQSFGVTEDEFLKRKEKLYLKTGIENNNSDVIWSIFNELLLKNAGNPDKLAMIYYSMAIFLKEEGKNNFKLLQECAKSRLDSFQLLGFDVTVEILGCSDSCEACKKSHGKIISMKEAYLLPIPCENCNHTIGFCRCYFAATSLRDDEGMLILK
ncbi:hypothetical protein [Flavobacterium sp. K5-23]|uniref:hypothetical protein n=1 Tax=Flavobacterium sp. K5-23 TaxID=2746225 RepID=UPI00200FFABB|nr:hypothetical protein [Flavobacterium sp. K5-23]UQD54962.1 hypothetical protein FLAK523_00595 [Flavobacterium sp. K5-23]